MARTVKWEHSTDSWHLNHRMERKARPAGRLVAVIEAEILADDPSDQELADWDFWEREALAWRAVHWEADWFEQWEGEMDGWY